jgi:hypothetical protein
VMTESREEGGMSYLDAVFIRRTSQCRVHLQPDYIYT